MGRYSNSGVGKRSYKEEKHWKELDFTKVKIKKPTLICLGGNGTIDDWQISNKKGYIITGSEKANGVCAIAERLIGLKPELQSEYSTYTNVDFYIVKGVVEELLDLYAKADTEVADDRGPMMYAPTTFYVKGGVMLDAYVGDFEVDDKTTYDLFVKIMNGEYVNKEYPIK